jgi:hypothetical protein
LQKRERERESIEKKRKEKENLLEFINKKMKSIFVAEKKHFNLKIFLRESIFSPSIILFLKPISKSFEKVS